MKIQILILLLLSTINILTQNSIQRIDERPYIEVTGTAEKQVNPDEIFIKFAVQEKYDGGNKITIESQEEKLKMGLNSIKIPVSDLTVNDADIDYTRIQLFKKDILISKEYTLKVSNANMLESAYNLLQTLGIKDANISRVSYSKIDSLKKEIRIIAIKSAKEKADYLLDAIGEKLGKPILITENSVSITNQNNYLNVGGGRSNTNVYFIDGVKTKQGGGDDIIQFEKIKIQASYYIKYAIQ